MATFDTRFAQAQRQFRNEANTHPTTFIFESPDNTDRARALLNAQRRAHVAKVTAANRREGKARSQTPAAKDMVLQRPDQLAPVWKIDSQVQRARRRSPLTRQPSPVHPLLIVSDTTSPIMAADPNWNQLIDYYTHAYYKRLWSEVTASFEYGINLNQMSISKPGEVIGEWLRDESRLHTLMADIASYMQHVEGVKLVSGDSLFFVHYATRLLRQRLLKSEVVDKNLLLHTYHLYNASLASQQLDAARYHLNGLQALLERVQIWIPQAILVLMVSTGVHAPEPVYARLPFRVQRVRHGVESPQPLGKTMRRFCDGLSPGIVEGAQHCSSLLEMYRSVVKDGKLKSDSSKQLFSARVRTTVSRLVRIEVDEASKVLLHALLMWTWSLDDSLRSLASVAATQIREKLLVMSLLESQTRSWLHVIGLVAAKDTITKKWYLGRALLDAAATGVSEEDSEPSNKQECLLTFVQNFLWLDQIQTPMLKQSLKVMRKGPSLPTDVSSTLP